MKIFIIILLITCTRLCAMDIIPENTILLSKEEALQKVHAYHKRGLSVQEGLIKDLRVFENTQVKQILRVLNLDIKQTFQEIQLAKKACDASALTHTIIGQNPGVLTTENYKKFIQKARTIGINPLTLKISKLDRNKHKNFNARTVLTWAISIKNGTINIDPAATATTTIEFAQKKLPAPTISHELLHKKENHPVTGKIINLLYELQSPSAKLPDVTFKKLKNNLKLAMENFAEQYGILDTLLDDPNYVNALSDSFKERLPSAYHRFKNNHISLFEKYVAAENITQLLAAERGIAREKAENILKAHLERKLKMAKELTKKSGTV